MYCKFCNTKTEAIDSTGAFCEECCSHINIDNLSKTKLTINKYIVKVPFSGNSRGHKVFHVDATSEDTAVHKVKNYNGGDLISEETDRDDRSEERQYATCDGLVNSEPEDYNWWKNKDNFPCMIICNFGSGDTLACVHYSIENNVYDCRDNAYELSQYSNWRRATKQEILANIKGL